MIGETMQRPEFKVEKENLYQEEYFTDMKLATIRRLTPVNQDGTVDQTRSIVFVGQANLMSEAGPIPISTMISAQDLPEAIQNYPQAMNQAMEKIQEEIRKYQQENQSSIASAESQRDSRIIVPGR